MNIGMKFEVVEAFNYDRLWKRINGKKALLSLTYQEGEIISLHPKRLDEFKTFIEEGYLSKVS